MDAPNNLDIWKNSIDSDRRGCFLMESRENVLKIQPLNKTAKHLTNFY